MPEREIFAVSKSGEFTQEEYEKLYDRIMAADDSGDQDEFNRLVQHLPINAKVLKAFAKVYGRDYILSMGFDMTQANKEFGEGWFDEIQ